MDNIDYEDIISEMEKEFGPRDNWNDEQIEALKFAQAMLFMQDLSGTED